MAAMTTTDTDDELAFLRGVLADPLAGHLYADWLEERGRQEEAAKARPSGEPAFRRVVEMRRAFDKRHADPSKNYGIGGVSLRMVLIGPRGAADFLLLTPWHLPHVSLQLEEMFLSARHGPAGGGDARSSLRALFRPVPAQVGYHSQRPLHEWQKPSEANCPYVQGLCYCDSSALAAEPMYETLLREGSEGVWAALRLYYEDTFAR